MDTDHFDIFLVTAPGLETALAQEALAAGFAPARAVPGGVEITGTLATVYRANLVLRGAIRVLVRLAAFRALHLAQLDKRARRIDWGAMLRPDVPVQVDAACRKSRIYHAGAAAQRVATAIIESIGAPVTETAPVRVMVRIEDDLATISIDSSGEPLHKRGHKQAVNAAPMRETIAALLLRQAGFDGTGAVLDPMCGSGTFVIEAAEMALGLMPGRARDFALTQLALHDEALWQGEREAAPAPTMDESVRFFGSDRDAGAIAMSVENAARAGVDAVTRFTQTPVSRLQRPDTEPGLVIVNPPYGARLSHDRSPAPLYAALGRTLRERFAGWRVAMVTTERKLAQATGLRLETPFPSVDNGGLRVSLYLGTVAGQAGSRDVPDRHDREAGAP